MARQPSQSSMTLMSFISTVATVLAMFIVYKLFLFVKGRITSPNRYLPGPTSSNWLFGNLLEIQKAENAVLHEEWENKYGHVLTYTGFLGLKRLYTTDTKAINHVLMHSFDYQKPEQARWALSRVVGHGVLVVEGEKHKQQRKAMNPAFGVPQIRELTSIFVNKSIELRDMWMAQLQSAGGGGSIEVLSWLNRATLDIIGLAGFNYEFNALDPKGAPNELNEAFATVFQSSTSFSVLGFLMASVPSLRIFEPLFITRRNLMQRRARATMSRIGNQLLNDSKSALLRSGEKGDSRARDLLSLLVKDNMAPEIEESQRMSDFDVLSQIATFIVAGHHTTSTATTWALYALAQDHQVQTKLREELLTLSTDTPSMEELNSLTYLDYVVRETLRIHSPVPNTLRVAIKDDAIPLNKPFTDTRGKTHEVIRVRKGDTVYIPILVLNRAKSLWGADAMEFKPDRWASTPEAVTQIPGVWGNVLSFLGGPRACIGYRFTLVEMKALLFVLIRAFEFSIDNPGDVMKKSSIVQLPILKSDPKGGNQLPLLVKLYHRD
ncbi:cytochrome P450 [Mycena floridula]|nr:cytochrome P450 [Mycena floridula]